MIEEQLDDIQVKKELCRMLKDLSEYLNKNAIQYSIMSGTMLGAVRHGGFIPWDDDIDIAILRKDYDHLVEILRNNRKINTELEISGYEINKTEIPFLKVYNKTIIVKDNLANNLSNLWIDIFPFDNVPDTRTFLYCKIVRLMQKLYQKNLEANGFYSLEATRKKGIYNYLNKLIVLVAGKINKDSLIESYIKFCKKYKEHEGKFIQDLTWGKKAVPRVLFDEIVDYQFDEILVKGFKDYDTYLKYVYGDYMRLPPETERMNHGIKAWKVINNEE
mgnify:CR=1 FL=1